MGQCRPGSYSGFQLVQEMKYSKKIYILHKLEMSWYSKVKSPYVKFRNSLIPLYLAFQELKNKNLSETKELKKCLVSLQKFASYLVIILNKP